MNGIIIINKPYGFTSFDVVAKLRNILSIKKIGHGGTLDPIATGVLPIFVGKATKIIDIIQDQNKEYVAFFKLGISTDTQDITGNIISEKNLFISKKDINNILNNFIGNISQIPPMYSAIKINGKRLYELARQGKEVERQPRNVTIYDIQLLSFDENFQIGSIKIKVSSGTYIRTVINDIGNQLGCGATMLSLIRSKAMGFNIKDSHKLNDIKKLKQENKINNILISPEIALKSISEIYLDNDTINKILSGIKIKINSPKLVYKRVYNSFSKFIGIGYTKHDDYFKFKYNV